MPERRGTVVAKGKRAKKKKGGTIFRVRNKSEIHKGELLRQNT